MLAIPREDRLQAGSYRGIGGHRPPLQNSAWAQRDSIRPKLLDYSALVDPNALEPLEVNRFHLSRRGFRMLQKLRVIGMIPRGQKV